jgi:hypothetical protein
MGGGQVARICRGQSPDLSIVRAAQLLSVLGMDLSARAYPAGPQVRDAAQLRLLERLRERIGAGLRWRIEVPVIELAAAGVIDRRAWDAAIDGVGWTVRIDAETHVGDLQAVVRRVLLKQRDARIACVILLLADTRHHRQLLSVIEGQLSADFPVRPRHALRALRDARSPGGNSLLLL